MIRTLLRLTAFGVVMMIAPGVGAHLNDALRPGSAGEIAFSRGGGVWIIDVDTREEREVARSGFDRPLTWSSDGRHLVWWDHRSGGWDLWRNDVDAGDAAEPVNLTPDTTGGCRSPTYSPDGRRIAFMRDLPPGLWLMNADGSDLRRLSEHGHRDVPPQWSPDGAKLLYVDLEHEGERFIGTRIRLYDLSSGDDQPLMMGDSPQWLSDDRFVFEATRNSRSAIVAADLDGSNEKILSSDRDGPEPDDDVGADAYGPALSPDRSNVAWLSKAGDGDLKTIMVRRLDEPTGDEREGGEGKRRGPRPVAALRNPAQPPAWSPDGRRLAIAVSGGEEPGLWLIDIDTGEASQLVAGEVFGATWRPRRLPGEP